MVKETLTVNLLTPKALIMNFLYIPLITFINTNGEQIFILIVLMSFDFVTGIMKSRKLCKRFTRYKLETGFYIKFGTLLLPFLFAFTSRGIGYDITAFISFFLGITIIIEFYSIIGNIYTIRTGKELEDKDLLSFALLSIRKKTEEELIKKMKDKK